MDFSMLGFYFIINNITVISTDGLGFFWIPIFLSAAIIAVYFIEFRNQETLIDESGKFDRVIKNIISMGHLQKFLVISYIFLIVALIPYFQHHVSKLIPFLFADFSEEIARLFRVVIPGIAVVFGYTRLGAVVQTHLDAQLSKNDAPS